MKSLLGFSGFLFSAFLWSMEAEKSLDELVSSIVVHSPGGVGIRDTIKPEILEEFVQKTEGVAYFDFKGSGWGYAHPKLSNKEFDPEKHRYAVALGKIESNDWQVLNKMGNVTLLKIGLSKRPLRVSQVEVLDFKPKVSQFILDFMKKDDVD